MAMFDPADKKNKPVVDFFSTKQVLIIDPNRTNRVSIKKLMTQLGVKLPNLHMSDNFEMAKEIIDQQSPEIIFSNYTVTNKTAIEILDYHIEKVENRLNTGFFVISENNSPVMATIPLEYDIDGLLTTPFTIDGLQTTVLGSITPKVAPSKYDMAVEEGRLAFYKNNFDHAIEVLSKAKSASKKPISALFLLGETFKKRKEMKKAQDNFEEGLTFDSKNYKCLNALYKLFQEQSQFTDAYRIAKTILTDYPLNPSKIPELIRLSIQNADFESILGFASVLNQIENTDPELKRNISAGLAICGKFFMTIDKKTEGKKSLEDSAKLSEGKKEIVENILNTLIDNNEVDFAEGVLTKYAGDTFDVKAFDILIFQLDCKRCSPDDIFLKAKTLINKGTKDILVYKPLIKAMKEMGKSVEDIEDITFEASREFPEYKEELQKDLESYKKQAT